MSTQLPMLPRRGLPGPPESADIRRALVNSVLADDHPISLREAMHFFKLDGGGFHHAGFALLCHTVMYKQAGHHTIAIPAAMQEALSNTSLAGIQYLDFVMPHITMYFALPDSAFQLWGGTTGWHRCAGVYVTRVCSAEEGYDVLKFYFWGIENERSSYEGDDASFWFEMDLKAMQEAEMDFDQYILKVLSNPANRTPNFHELNGDAPVMDTGHLKDIHKLTRLIVNSVLYLNTPDAVIQLDAEAEALRKEAGELMSAWRRIKNKNKGKAKRMVKRYNSIPKDDIIWIGDVANATSEQPIVTEGSWWPRKDLLRAKLTAMRDDPENQERSDLLDDAESRMANATDVEDIAQCVREIRDHRKWFDDRMSYADELGASLNATRRWIRPRRKAKGG